MVDRSEICGETVVFLCCWWGGGMAGLSVLPAEGVRCLWFEPRMSATVRADADDEMSGISGGVSGHLRCMAFHSVLENFGVYAVNLGCPC